MTFFVASVLILEFQFQKAREQFLHWTISGESTMWHTVNFRFLLQSRDTKVSFDMLQIALEAIVCNLWLATRILCSNPFCRPLAKHILNMNTCQNDFSQHYQIFDSVLASLDVKLHFQTTTKLTQLVFFDIIVATRLLQKVIKIYSQKVTRKTHFLLQQFFERKQQSVISVLDFSPHLGMM